MGRFVQIYCCNSLVVDGSHFVDEVAGSIPVEHVKEFKDGSHRNKERICGENTWRY